MLLIIKGKTKNNIRYPKKFYSSKTYQNNSKCFNDQSILLNIRFLEIQFVINDFIMKRGMHLRVNAKSIKSRFSLIIKK